MRIIKNKKAGIKALLAVGIAVAILLIPLFTFNTEAYNYEYRNVTVQVNVTNAIPEILAITVEDPITLSAGSTQVVTCNATIRDWNGFNDLETVNATLYYHLNASGPDHNNVHYTNSSCSEDSNDGQYLANYTCSFDVWYYANNGTWECNITATDFGGLYDTAVNSTTVNALFALNVTSIIDYGNLSVTDTSSDVVANVTNFGNTDINVTVLGYGDTEGDGLGFVCELGTDISVEHQRFSNAPMVWDDKTPLDSTAQDMEFTMFQPTQETVPVIRTTYWQLFVPPNPFGLCTGTVRFTATLP